MVESGRSSFEFRVASTERVVDVALVMFRDMFCHFCCLNVKGNVSSNSNSRGKAYFGTFPIYSINRCSFFNDAFSHS